MFCIDRLQSENTVNTINCVNIVSIQNIVDFNAIRYKKQYNGSPQLLISRQTGNSIEKDKSLAMYLSNSYS